VRRSRVHFSIAYDQAKETLVSHREQLELVAAELLKSETIDGPTFYKLVSQEMPSLSEPGRLAAAAGIGVSRGSAVDL
jgi:hypothetical protein